MKPLLEVKNASRLFGGLAAVDDVSFDVASGMIFALIGPNGAGKTTLFNLIAGAMRPTSGKILYKGKPVRDDWRAARAGIGRTFQNARLFRDMSVLENVLVSMGHDGWLSASLRLPSAVENERRLMRKATLLLEEVGLDYASHHKAGNIPFGQQRLLEIARTLAMEPQLLLLDEPAAGLNKKERASLSDLIRSIRNRGITILLVEHDMNLVMNIAERIVVLDQGKKIAEGSPDQIAGNKEVVEAYLGADG